MSRWIRLHGRGEEGGPELPLPVRRNPRHCIPVSITPGSMPAVFRTPVEKAVCNRPLPAGLLPSTIPTSRATDSNPPDRLACCQSAAIQIPLLLSNRRCRPLSQRLSSATLLKGTSTLLRGHPAATQALLLALHFWNTWAFCLFFFMVFGTEPRTLYVLGKPSTDL